MKLFHIAVPKGLTHTAWILSFVVFRDIAYNAHQCFDRLWSFKVIIFIWKLAKSKSMKLLNKEGIDMLEYIFFNFFFFESYE